MPAAFNGLVGLKPSRGRLSTAGVVPACRSLDCVSIFTRTLNDSELVYRQCSGFDPSDPYSREFARADRGAGPKGVLGVPYDADLEFFGDQASQTAYADYLSALSALGWRIAPFDYAPFKRAAALLYQGPWVAERQLAFGDFIARQPDSVNPVVRQVVGSAPTYSARELFAAQYELAKIQRQTASVWAS